MTDIRQDNRIVTQITTVKTCPPPFCVSVSTDSSNVITSKPLCLNAVLAISGSMFCCNH